MRDHTKDMNICEYEGVTLQEFWISDEDGMFFVVIDDNMPMDTGRAVSFWGYGAFQRATMHFNEKVAQYANSTQKEKV